MGNRSKLIITVTIFFVAVLSSLGSDTIATEEGVVDTLAGELPSRVKNSGRPYLVMSDISVRPGETVVLEAGTVLLFRNFTGLQIHGVLKAEGTEDAPLVFTSENDTAYSPVSTMPAAPYDWNGITVFENAVGTSFEQCRVGYSLYGINSLTEQIIIRDCRFRQNGRSDFAVNGEVVEVGSGAFTNGLGDMPAPELAELFGAELVQKAKPSRVVLRVGSAVVGLAGIGVGVYKTFDYRKSKAHFDIIKETTRENKEKYNSDDWDEANNHRKRDLLYMLLGYGGGALGLFGFSISFTF